MVVIEVEESIIVRGDGGLVIFFYICETCVLFLF